MASAFSSIAGLSIARPIRSSGSGTMSSLGMKMPTIRTRSARPVVRRGRAGLLVVVVPAVVDVVTHGEAARVGRQLADGGLVRPLGVRQATRGDHRLVHVVEAAVGREGQRVLAAGHGSTLVVDPHQA